MAEQVPLAEISESEKIKKETRDKLIDQFTSRETRELAFRLSIFFDGFQRKNALALASYPTTIPTPGAIFDKLVGSYVEQISRDYYQLTPLLDNAAENVYPVDDMKILHALAGRSFISGIVSTSDIANILKHGFSSSSSYLLLNGCLGFEILVKQDYYKRYARLYLSWFTNLTVTPGEKLFGEIDQVSLHLRRVQFEITLIVQPEKINQVIDAWQFEIKSYIKTFPSFKKDDEWSKYAPFAFYTTILTHYSEIPLMLGQLSDWVCDALECIKIYPEIDREVDARFQVKYSIDIKIHSFKFVFIHKLLDKVTSSNIEELLSVITHHKQGLYLLSLLDQTYTYTIKLTTRSIREEKEEGARNWKQAKNSLKKLITFAKDYHAVNIIAWATFELAFIEEHYLSDKVKANMHIKRGVKLIGYEHPVLLYYRAKTLFGESNDDKALEVWQKLLPGWKNVDNEILANAYRDAYISAGNTGNWLLAAAWIKQSIHFAGLDKDRLYETQCRAEYAFSLWKQQKMRPALKEFVHVIETLPALPNVYTDPRSLGFMTMLHATFGWILKTIDARPSSAYNDFREVSPGGLSEKTYTKSLKQNPLGVITYLLINLAEIESKTNAGSTIVKKLIKGKEKLTILDRTKVEEIIVRKHLIMGDIDNLVNEESSFIAYRKAFEQMYKNYGEELNKIHITFPPGVFSQFVTIDIKELIITLSISLLSFVKKYSLRDIPLEHWRQDALRLGIYNHPLWIEWFRVLERSASLPVYESEVVLEQSDAAYVTKILVNILQIIHESNPSYLFSATLLVMKELNNFYLWREGVGNSFAVMVTKRWKKVIHDRQVAPIYIFSINQACDDKEKKGLRKVANILLSARHAVDIPVNTETINQLTKLAE